MFKTTIIIWSEKDPTDKYELPELAQAATDGDMYCSLCQSVEVTNPENDSDWDGSEFFFNSPLGRSLG